VPVRVVTQYHAPATIDLLYVVFAQIDGMIIKRPSHSPQCAI